jgi:hypothetical protein
MKRLLDIVAEQEGDVVGFTEYVTDTFGEFGDVEADLDDEAGTGTFSIKGDGWKAEVTVEDPEAGTGKLLIVDTETKEELDGEEFEEGDLESLLDAIYDYIEDGLEGDEDEEEEVA